MPHLPQEDAVVETAPSGGVEDDPEEKTRKDEIKKQAYALLMDTLDISAGLMFVAGSACFLPVFAQYLEVYIEGCFLFVLGSVIYVGISAFCLREAVRTKGYNSADTSESLLYLVGSVLFLVGTVLYWPNHEGLLNMAWAKQHSLGAYFNLFTAEYEAILFFICGSLVFAAAAYVNSIKARRAVDAYEATLLMAANVTYVAGSLLLVVGSVACLPRIGHSEFVLTLSAASILLGSFLYVVGGVLNMARTWSKLQKVINSCGERQCIAKR